MTYTDVIDPAAVLNLRMAAKALGPPYGPWFVSSDLQTFYRLMHCLSVAQQKKDAAMDDRVQRRWLPMPYRLILDRLFPSQSSTITALSWQEAVASGDVPKGYSLLFKTETAAY